jgi:glutathione S-transferase
MTDQTPLITAYDWVPDFAQGHVRDLRVRWALEEAGRPYEVDLVPQGSQRAAANVARQPFGQIPTLRDAAGCLFESGAIVWRIAERSEALLPTDPGLRDKAFCWLFAALNTVEPPVSMLAVLDIFTRDREAAQRVRPDIVSAIEHRLASLQSALGENDYLVGDFTAADLMMVTVLRNLTSSGLLGGFPALHAYVERAMARPAFQAALEGQLATFRQNATRYAAAE